MKYYHFDAVVVGSGCAGYNCADRLFESGVKNIAIVTEGRTLGTSRNTGSDKQTYYKLSLAGDSADSVIDMARDLFAGGGMDGDVALAEAANSARCFLRLAALGVPFPTNAFGEFVGYKTDHDPRSRATSMGPYTSKRMTEVLERSVREKGIAVLDGLRAVKVLTDENGVVGLLLADVASGELSAVSAPHVALCTGGPASVYRDSVYPFEHTGTSSLALDAGASFSNLCEWQYGLASVDFRWNVSGTYQQVLPRYVSVDEKGVEREFLNELGEKKALELTFLKGYEWPFDVRKLSGSSRVDLMVFRETAVLGRKVYLDFTREPEGLRGGFGAIDGAAREYLENSDALIPLPIARLKKMNAGAIELYRSHGIDIEREPLRIAVCAQHNNGGIGVDCDWQTDVPGLYAAGEAAGTLGVFRPGGSALNSSQVGSLRAARHIAFFSDRKPSAEFEKKARAAAEEATEFIKTTRGGKSTLAGAASRYRAAMSEHFAFLRNIEDMETGVAAADENFLNFRADNRWEKPSEIAELFRNYETVRMQQAICRSMLYAAKKFGSRGSSFVLRGGDFLTEQPVPENTEGRGRVVTARAVGADIEVSDRAVRPIPPRELWFEKVWNEYKRTEEI